MSTLLKNLTQNTYVHVAFGFLAMGSWALFASFEHPMPRPIFAALTQGCMSALLTLYLKKVVDGLQSHFSGNFKYWVPPLIAAIGSASMLIIGHIIAATPEMLATIAVPLTVSVLYIFTYSIMRQLNKQEASNE